MTFRVPEIAKNMGFETKLLLLLTVPVAIVMLIHYFMTGFVIYNDGRGYYLYLRSAVIDRDINFSNEWAYYNSAYSKFSSEPRAVNLPRITKTGHTEDIHLIGNAIMWSPFFLAAHAASLLLNSTGLPVKADGYTFLYEMSIGIASLIYGFLGMWLIYKFCRKWFEKGTALLATIAVWYGTAAFWYHAVEPSMSHMNSLFLIALFTSLWYNTLEKRTKAQWLMLGLMLGLIYLVRQQEIVLGLLPAFEVAKSILKKIDFKRARTLIKNAANAATFGVGMLIALLPQMLVWKRMYGSFMVFTYGNTVLTYRDTTGVEIPLWTIPQLIPILFSLESGMWRVPLLALSIAGVFLFAARVRGIAWYFLAIVITEFILTASWTGWTNGYGIRLLVGMSIFFALGAAELIERLKKKLGVRVTRTAVFLLIAANFVNMVIVMLSEVSSRIPLGDVQRLLIKTFF